MPGCGMQFDIMILFILLYLAEQEGFRKGRVKNSIMGVGSESKVWEEVLKRGLGFKIGEGGMVRLGFRWMIGWG